MAVSPLSTLGYRPLSGGSYGSSNRTSGTAVGGIFSTTLAHVMENARNTSPLSGEKPTESSVQAFQEYMQKPYAERFMDNWLSRHGLTREEFEALPPDEQKRLLDQMREELKQEVREKVTRSEDNPLLSILV